MCVRQYNTACNLPANPAEPPTQLAAHIQTSLYFDISSTLQSASSVQLLLSTPWCTVVPLAVWSGVVLFLSWISCWALLPGWRSNHRIWKTRPLLLYPSRPSFFFFFSPPLLLFFFPFFYRFPIFNEKSEFVAPLCGGKSSIQYSILERQKKETKKKASDNKSSTRIIPKKTIHEESRGKEKHLVCVCEKARRLLSWWTERRKAVVSHGLVLHGIQGGRMIFTCRKSSPPLLKGAPSLS